MLCAFPKPEYRASFEKVTGMFSKFLNRFKSKTCIPWFDASLTIKAKLLKTFTSLHELDTVWVSKKPNITGAIGFVILMNVRVLFEPIKAYSFPEIGSVQPQQSFPALESFNSDRGICANKS